MKLALSCFLGLALGGTVPMGNAADEKVSASAKASWADQCASAAGFADYRQRLERAVARRDPAALRVLVSPKVQTDFGGGAGWRAFSKAWNLDQPQQSAVWEELAEVMRLGCVQEEGYLVMPALFSTFPDDVDPFEAVVATRSGAVWPKAREEGTPLRTFGPGEVLTLAGPLEDEHSWVPVRATETAVGFAHADQVRSPTDYRALFRRERGNWKLVIFLAGD